MNPTRRHAVVSGGGSGIGRAVALRLAADGAAVTLLDRDGASARRVQDEIAAAGGKALGCAADVAEALAVGAAIDAGRVQFGPVGILVTVAGHADFSPISSMAADSWQRMLDVHLGGTFHCVQAVLPDLLQAGWGRIVTLASVAGLNGGGAGLAHYAAAKGGIIAMSKALALELGPQGITVNSVAPGLIDTPGLRASGLPQAALDAMCRGLPLRRLGTPDDVAASVAFAVSDAAGFLTGQVLSPNGGAYL